MDAADITMAGIEADLAMLLRVRTPTQAREVAVPHLRAACAHWKGQGGESAFVLDDFIAAGLARMGTESYRSAAEALFKPGEERWRPLTTREREAASRFGITYDAYRRSRPGTRSRREQTMAELAASLLALAGIDVAAPPSVPPLPVDTASGRPRRAWMVLACAAVLAAVAGTIGLLVGQQQTHQDSGGSAAASTSGQRCSSSPDQPAPADLAGYRQVLAAAVETSGGSGTLGCVSGPATRWRELVIQPVGGDRGSVVVARSPTDAFVLTSAEWSSFRDVSDGTLDGQVGLPSAPQVVGHHIEIATSYDGVFVGEARDGPFFLVLPLVKNLWLGTNGANGPYGLPTSNPVMNGSSFRQEFAHGYVTVGADRQLAFTPVPYAQTVVPSAWRRHILRNADNTSWWVGGDGVRRWIPAGDVFTCFGGWGRAINNVPGYAIASLPLGPPARCSDASTAIASG